MELVLENLTKRYGNKKAVDNCNAVLQEGIYGLLGSNGSGKTTLMRMLASLIKPTTGAILLDGQHISMLDEFYREKIGYLPQHFGYYPNFTGIEFMVYIASLKGIPKMIAVEQSERLLRSVGLEDVSNKKVKTYSGGMKQRLGFAQSLLGNPKILILDEPTAGLDPAERIRFRRIVANEAKGKIILISTHIVSDIEKMADQILIIKEGKIVYLKTEDELLDQIRGKVFIGEVNEHELAMLSSNCSIVNMQVKGCQYLLRVIADQKPHDGFKESEPNLEDFYLHIFEEERSISE